MRWPANGWLTGIASILSFAWCSAAIIKDFDGFDLDTHSIAVSSFPNENVVSALKLLKQGKDNKAILLAKTAIKESPDSVDGHFLMGTILFELKRYEDSREAFLEALRINSDHPLALNGLGVVYHQLGNDHLALIAMIHSLESDMTNAEVWANYLSILNDQLVTKAKQHSALPEPKAKTKKQALYQWHWQAAVQAMNEKQADLSVRHFLRALSMELNDANVHNDFSVLLNQMNHKVLALPFIRAAAKLAPESPIAKSNLDLLSKQVSETVLQAQIKSLQKKISTKPTAEDHAALAHVYRLLKRNTEMVKQLESAVQLDTNSIKYQFELAQALARTEQYRKAFTVMQPVLRSNPENPQYQYRMAWLLLRQDEISQSDSEQAVAYAQTACKLTQNQRKDCNELLILALKVAGKEQEARDLAKSLGISF